MRKMRGIRRNPFDLKLISVCLFIYCSSASDQTPTPTGPRQLNICQKLKSKEKPFKIPKSKFTRAARHYNVSNIMSFCSLLTLVSSSAH